MMSSAPASKRIFKGGTVPIDGAPVEPGLALIGEPAAKTCLALVKGARSNIDVTKVPVSCQGQP